MAKIRSEDLFDKSLEKTIKSLVEAENMLIKTTKELAASAKQLKKAFGESGIKNLTDLQKQYQQQVKISNTVEKNAIEIQKRKEALEQARQRTVQAATRTEIQARKEAERMAKQAAKNAREAAKLNSSYSRLSRSLTEARNKAKDMAATYGTTSRQFRNASREVRTLDNRLKKIDSRVGQNQRNVGNYKSALSGVTGVLGQMGVAFGGVQIAMKTFTGIVKNSQVAGDAWAVTVAGMEGSLQGFFRAVGSGQFEKVLDFMQRGRDAAKEYAIAMDDLFEGGQGAKIQIAELNQQIAEWETIRKNAVASKDYQEVIRSAERIGEIETEKLRIIQQENRKRFEAESENLQKITGLEEERFIAFLRNWREEESLRQATNDYLNRRAELEDDIRKAYNFRGREAGKLAEQEKQLFEDSVSSQIKEYAKLVEEYGVTTDEMVQRTIDAYVAMTDANTSSIKQQQQNQAAMARAIEMASKESTDNVEEIEREFFFKRMDLIDSYKAEVRELSKVQISEAEETSRKLAEIDQSRFEKFKEIQNKKKELQENVEQELYNLGTELGNALFESRIQNYEEDLEENSEYYDNLLANQELSEEQRALLEAKRLEKENEIRARQRQAERQQFLFNQGVAIAEIAIETAKNVAANPLFAPFYISLGAIQTGIVLAQSIPQFAKGTDDAPEGPAIVGEKGTELVVSKDKKTAWLTDNKPQLTNLNKGDKVIPHSQLLDSINNYTNSQIVNNSDKITGNDEKIGWLVSQMLDKSDKNTKSMIKELRQLKPKQVKQTTLDRMRTDDLKSKLRN